MVPGIGTSEFHVYSSTISTTWQGRSLSIIALMVQSSQNDGRSAKYSRACSLLTPCIVQAADMVKSKNNALVNGVTPEMHQSIHWNILVLLQKKTLVCHSLRRSHVMDQLEKEEIQSSIQNVMWVQLSCVIQMKQRIITVLIVVGRGLSGHIMKEATSIILTHKIHGRANRQLQSYPQHKLEIRVAWTHEENTPVQQYTTISISIACRITEASRSQSHQKIVLIPMHARTKKNMHCMWSSGSLHNAAITPIDLTPCAAKLTEAVEKGPAVCVSLTPSHQLPTHPIFLQQLNESCRHHIIAMVNSLNQWVLPCPHHHYSHKE